MIMTTGMPCPSPIRARGSDATRRPEFSMIITARFPDAQTPPQMATPSPSLVTHTERMSGSATTAS